MRKTFYCINVRIIFLSILISTSLIPACFKAEASPCSLNVEQFTSVKTDTGFRVIIAPGNRYGYEILAGKKVLIKQFTIPGRAGIHGFKTKAEANKVAGLVVKKLSQGIMPPTIDEQELLQLNIYP